MPGDDGVKKGKRKGKEESLQDALRQLEEAKQSGLAAVQAAEELAAMRQRMQSMQGGGGQGGGNEPQQFVGSLSDLDVNFDPMTAPPPAFAGVCVVHRFPEYVMIDFGSIDPLRVEPTGPGSGRAMLQHVGRLCLPVSVAKRLVSDLTRSLGQ